MRELTANERAVLEYVVVDADTWWSHANSVDRIDPEGAIAGKVAKWQDDYDTAVAAGNYQNRAERDAEE